MTNFRKRHLANRRYLNLIYKILHYGLSHSVTDCISFYSQCALYVLSQQQQLNFRFYILLENKELCDKTSIFLISDAACFLTRTLIFLSLSSLS